MSVDADGTLNASGGSSGGSYPADVRNAGSFSGTTGGDQIQAALDDLPSTGGAVLVGPEGPDDVSGSTGALSARDTAAWEVTSTITIPSNTAVVLVNAYIFLADGTDDNIFRNETATSGDSTRDENIAIVGEGHAIIDGNGGNQTDTLASDRYKETDIRFNKVDALRLSGFTNRECASWGIVPEDVTDVVASDLVFDYSGNLSNQDGLHVVGPAESITASNLSGRFGDDTVAVNATDAPEQGIDAGGDVVGVDVSNVSVRDTHRAGALRTAASDAGGNEVRNISVSNIDYDATGGGGVAPIKLGGGDAANENLHTNINITNLGVKGVPLTEL